MDATDQTPNEPVDVLIVEDNPGDIRLTKEAFRSIQSDVRFHTAKDGGIAVDYLQECERSGEDPFPDLVFLDLNLPRVSGHEFLSTLEDDCNHPAPPVLVLSSSHDPDDIIRSYERSANAYLTKPSSPTEYETLAEAIEAFWIDTAQHPPAPA
ncbi:response regulator [Natronorubrum sp. JWXQ-INN-674]|uniref:Response regulator n=1 Tax=Natronorubrum halalkaliphilum TaxID=2691917 RepID=A0A6B0VJB0_9EURY|nr:response regulator [Natronorubrum halalkaliphilum]MXV61618.1 response regulator [Natronorubrum halalkaliphilum]